MAKQANLWTQSYGSVMAIKFQMLEHGIYVWKAVLRLFFGYKHLLTCKWVFDSGLMFLVFE